MIVLYLKKSVDKLHVCLTCDYVFNADFFFIKLHI